MGGVGGAREVCELGKGVAGGGGRVAMVMEAFLYADAVGDGGVDRRTFGLG